MAKPEYLKYSTLEEYYSNLSVNERVALAKKTRSLKVLNLLADDRAGSVRKAVAANSSYQLENKISSIDFTLNEIPGAVLDWVENSGTAEMRSSVAANRNLSARTRKKFASLLSEITTTVVEERETSAQFSGESDENNAQELTAPAETVTPKQEESTENVSSVINHNYFLTHEEQSNFFYSKDIEKLVFLALAPETESNFLRKIAAGDNKRLLVALARRSHAPDDVLAQLVKTGDEDVHIALASKYHLDDALADRLYNFKSKNIYDPYREDGVYMTLARNAATPTRIIAGIVNSSLPFFVWRFGVLNPSRVHVLAAALQNANCPGDVLYKCVRYNNHDLMRMVLHNPSLTDADRKVLYSELNSVSHDIRDLGL